MRAARLSVLGLLALAGGLGAIEEGQTNYSAARSSGRLDGSGVSARDQAMGNAVAAVGQGPLAFQGNPALLAGQGAAYALDQVNNLFFSRSLLSASQGFGAFSGGASLGYADLGSVEGFDANGKAYSVRPYQVSLGLGAAKPLKNKISAGLAAHGLLQSFGSFGNKTAFSGVGGLAWAHQGWSLGLAQALESDLDRSSQTYLSSMKASAAYGLAWLGSQRSILALQMDYDYADTRILRAGLEHLAFGTLALRGGYEEPLDAALSFPQWTLGMGVLYREWRADFSYASRSELGTGLRATLTWAPRSLPAPAMARPAAALSVPAVALPNQAPGALKPAAASQKANPKKGKP